MAVLDQLGHALLKVPQIRIMEALALERGDGLKEILGPGAPVPTGF
jgi:hypothetical protein